MLFAQVDSAKYVAEFKDKFSNFAQKAPILLSFITTDEKVTVIHENSKNQYEFEWDFTIPVKSFIHGIKQTLSDGHYPRIVKVTRTQVPLTADEQAERLTEGKETEPFKEVEERELFKIDKVIALKDIFMIQSEDTFKTYRYRMNYSSIFFLKGYRTGKYKNLEEAGDFFFKRSTMLNEVVSRT